MQQWSPVLGISSINDLLLPITLVFVAASIVAGAIRLLSLWLSGRLAAIGSDLSCEAYLRTLHQPYSVQVARNSSSLIASISADLSTGDLPGAQSTLASGEFSADRGGNCGHAFGDRLVHRRGLRRGDFVRLRDCRHQQQEAPEAAESEAGGSEPAIDSGFAGGAWGYT